MQLTDSWKTLFPASVLDRYDFAETRNAASVLQATSPQAFADIVNVLDSFELTVDKLTTPGKNKSVIASELDAAFRTLGWREARFEQTLTTRLVYYRWTGSPDPNEAAKEPTVTVNDYGGHKVDNVSGRAALDVEWNPKDGNLDRDLANYVGLYEGGVIDAGVILTRVGGDLRYLVRDLIATAKSVPIPEDNTAFGDRMRKLADDPLGTSTTSNFGKLVPRLQRGDARGCPLLAIAITDRCYVPPQDDVAAEIGRLSAMPATAVDDEPEDQD